MANKLPAMQLYPGDWLQDDIAGCSLAAQGLWLRMMFVAHRSDQYGYLSMTGSALPSATIAQRCGCTLAEYESLIVELVHAGVPSESADGRLFSRRMVRDAQKRRQSAVRSSRYRHARVTRSVTPQCADEDEVAEKEIKDKTAGRKSGGKCAPNAPKNAPVTLRHAGYPALYATIVAIWWGDWTAPLPPDQKERVDDLCASYAACGASAAELEARYERCKAAWSVPVTAKGLLDHWGEFADRGRARTMQPGRPSQEEQEKFHAEAVADREKWEREQAERQAALKVIEAADPVVVAKAEAAVIAEADNEFWKQHLAAKLANRAVYVAARLTGK